MGPIDFHWFHEFFFDLFYFYNCSLWRPRRLENRLACLQTPSQNLGQTSRVQTGQLWRSFCQGRFPFQFTKGQLISKCPHEIIVSSKIPTKLFLDFCPEIFCTFLGASLKLFGLLGDLLSNIIIQEAQKTSRKPLRRYKKFQGRNNFVNRTPS